MSPMSLRESITIQNVCWKEIGMVWKWYYCAQFTLGRDERKENGHAERISHFSG